MNEIISSTQRVKNRLLNIVVTGDLRFNGSVIQKGRFNFMKERRIVRQKSGWSNHSNKQIFQVNIQMQGWINDSWNGGFISIKVWGFALLI